MSQFKRAYELEFGRPIIRETSASLVLQSSVNEDSAITTESGGVIFTDPLLFTGDSVDAIIPFNETRYGLGRGESLILTQHRIKFNTKKSTGSATNETEIDVYNLSPDSYGFISYAAGKNLYIRLSAGYEGDLKLILSGAVTGIKDVYEGQDRITTILIGEGATNYKEAYSSISVPAGTFKQVVYDRLKSDLGLPDGIVIKPQGRFKAAWSFEGSTVEGFENLAKDTDSSFSVQNFKINFLPYASNQLVTVATYSPETGLIGSPTALDRSAGTLSGNNKAPKVGIRFKIFLDGAVIPNTLVRIQSKLYDGVFKIEKVKHFGDTRGNDWFTECEASQRSLFSTFDSEEEEES